MRIRQLHIDNFKSLIDFDLDLAKFTCLIGLNGVGKSTVLQCIDFLAQQVRGDIEEWLGERTWQPKDLKSRLMVKNNIDFRLEIVDHSDRSTGSWQGSFNTTKMYCTSEHLTLGGIQLDVRDGTYIISHGVPNSGVRVEGRPYLSQAQAERKSIEFSYEGSILSQLKDAGLPGPIVEFKRFLQNTRSLDLLSPEQLRQRTRESSGSLGLGGKKLSSFLHELGPEKRANLSEQLKRAYKQLESLNVRSLQYGWKLLEIQERFGNKKLTTEARHINDGMLRLTAILSELGSDHRFVLLDEIENGINPELVEFLIDLLTTTPKQVLVTTHSPLILNYMEDELARSGVLYLYKTADGYTKAVPFFKIPSLAKKLEVMGPGEAFVDTNLTLLGQEIEQMPESR
jgi:predicted ATPase